MPFPNVCSTCLRGVRAIALAAVFGALAILPAGAEGQPPWPDTLETRLAALALIETLNAEILASRSATLTLEQWCADHKLAATPRIVAHLDRGADKPPTAEQRQRLQVSGAETVKFRHVELPAASVSSRSPIIGMSRRA